MPWVKLDDRFFSHPKVIDLDKDAKLLYLAALTHCASQLTDGRITSGALRMLCGLVDVPREIAKTLVDARLWEPTDDGYAIHDYHQYNPTAEEARQKQDEIRRVRSEAGKKGMASRWGGNDNKITNGVTPQVIESSYQTDNPVPVPVSRSDSRTDAPETAKALVRTSGTTAEPRETRPSDASTSDVWRAYDGAYLARYGVHPVRNAKVNGQLAQLVRRIPANEAPDIATFFLGSSNQWYVKKGHSVGCLLEDCEKIRTEWLTGHTITQREAVEADRMQGTGQMWAELRQERSLQNGT